MRRVCTGMAALAAGLVITCAPVGAETIRFGGILPLTGPGALIGTAEMRGVQFAVDQANAKGGVHGNQIEVLFEDNQAKPDQSILSFNKLTDLQHVSVIFTGYSGPTLAMAPLATRKKVLLINAGAQADGLAKASPYLINTLPTIGGEIEVISRWAVGDGKKKAGILFENGAAGMAGRDDYLKSFAEAGGTVVAQESSQFGQTDFRPALLKIADAKPDVMLVVITAGLLQMAQEYKQLDLKFTVAGTTFFADPSTDRRSGRRPASCTPSCGSTRRRTSPRSSRPSTTPTWSSSPSSTTTPRRSCLRRSTRSWRTKSLSPARSCMTRCSRSASSRG